MPPATQSTPQKSAIIVQGKDPYGTERKANTSWSGCNGELMYGTPRCVGQQRFVE